MVETTGVADPLPVVLTFLARNSRSGASRFDRHDRGCRSFSSIISRVRPPAISSLRRHRPAQQVRPRGRRATAGARGDDPDDAAGSAILPRRGARSDPAHPERRPVPVRPVFHRSAAELGGADDHAGSDRASAHDHLTADSSESLSFQSQRHVRGGQIPGLPRAASRRVYRAKGLIWIKESETRYVFHLVARRFALDPSERDGPATNKLVLIGRDLDRERLRGELEACLAPAPCSGIAGAKVDP